MSPHRIPAALPQPLPSSDGVFGDIAELAAQLCGAGYAVITLHDGLRHRPIASRGGLNLEVLPRDSRFCCEVFHAGAPLEVSDAHFDLRFHDDPLVARAPRVRFYSGVPLVTESGAVTGTLSVLDEQSKVLAGTQREALWKLADVVVRLLADIAARREAEESLSWQATHDTLTDLVNRRQFEATLASHIESARAKGIRHALVYIDLDQFKVVNDTCGHLAGDALLRQLARVLEAKMRRGDCLARLGGDEFGVLLEGCDMLHAQVVAAQLLAAVRGFRFARDRHVFSLGASIGVAAITAESRDPEAVLSAADTACYLAKDKGRNQVQVYRMEDEEVSVRQGQMGWVSRITRSIEEDRFFLHCQRVVALKGIGGDEYLELLLRMRDESGRTVTPGAFIPAAERYHLMGRVDRWVVERALGCLGRHRALPGQAGRLPRFGINLSGMSLGDPAFSEFVQEQLDRTGVPPDALCFEITETAAISDLVNAARFIRRFRALGCRFALDDFGSGLSSFAYLKALPVDYLKIDGSIVRDSVTDPVDQAMVDAICRLAKGVGARTVAESVESVETIERLRALGIDLVQGYAIHVPEPYADLAARMGYPREEGCSEAA
ncbi:MAG: EAL domain-containing protein [Betaproteobacteria bacterium]|nr:EAL domain-containing protein [Betaproteobacteria bacterium]